MKYKKIQIIGIIILLVILLLQSISAEPDFGNPVAIDRSAYTLTVNSQGLVSGNDPLLAFLLSENPTLTQDEIAEMNSEISSLNEISETNIGLISQDQDLNIEKERIIMGINSNRGSSQRASYYSRLITRQGLENLAKFASTNQKEFTIKVPVPDESDTLEVPGREIQHKSIVIEQAGKEFLVLTSEYKLEQSTNGKLKIIDRQPFGYTFPITLLGNEIALQGRELTITPEGESYLLESDYLHSYKQVSGHELRKIQQTKFKIDSNGEITYVKFISKEGDKYPLTNNGETYTVAANKGGKVEIDFTQKTINLENINDFYIGAEGAGRFWMGEDPEAYRKKGLKSNGKLSIKLNEKGKVASATFENMVFSPNAGNFYSINGPMTVVLDDKNQFNALKEDGTTKNLVFIGDSEILLKGKVNADNLNSNHLFYRGKGDNSYVEFDRTDDHFDVKTGAVTLGDEAYEISIENGEAKFRKTGISGKEHEFSFEHINNEKLKEEVSIKTSSNGDELNINLYNKKGEKVVSFPLSKNILKDKIQVSVPDLISHENIKNILKGEIKINQGALDKLTEEGKEGTKEWYEAKLKILKAQASLNPYEGKTSSDTLTEVQTAIEDINSKSDKNEYTKILREYYNQEGDLLTNKISKSSPIATYRVGPLTYEFKLGSSGEVRAVSSDGGETWKEIKSDSDWPRPIREILGLRNEEHSVNALKKLGASIPEGYEENIRIAYQARESYRNANDLSAYKKGELESKEIQTMIALGDYSEAERLAKRSIDLNNRGDETYDPEFVAKTRAQLATALFLDGKSIESKKVIEEARNLYKGNPEIEQIYHSFTIAQLATISNLASQEDERVFRDLAALTGDLGEGSSFQGFFDGLGALGTPWSGRYKAKNIDFFIKEGDKQIDRGKLIGLTSTYMQQLVDNGIDLEEYNQGSYVDKMLAVYNSAGLDDLISTNDLNQILTSNELKTSNPENRQEILLGLLEQKGYSRNNPELQNRFDETKKIMDLIEKYAVSSENADPTLRSLMTGGDFVGIGDRLGSEIKLSPTEYKLLFASDVILNPLNLVGAGFTARGTSASAQTLNLGLTTGLKTTAKAWTGMTSRQLANSYLKEVIVDAGISYSLEGLAKVDPELARTIGLGVGVLAVGAFSKGTLDSLAKQDLGVKLYGDLSGNNRFFVSSLDDLDKLKTKFGGTFTGKGILPVKTWKSILTTTIDGKEISVYVNPQSSKKLFEVSSLAITRSNSQARTVQGTLDDLIKSHEGRSRSTLEGLVNEASINKKEVEFITIPSGERIPIPARRNLPEFDPQDALAKLELPPSDTWSYQIAEKWIAKNPGRNPEGYIFATTKKLVDNVEHIKVDELRSYLKSAARELSQTLGDEPYVVVFDITSKSNTWAYDLAKSELRNPPAGIIFMNGNGRSISMKYPLDGYFDQGIKNYVIFDDASYSGSQLGFEFGEDIPRHYRGYQNNAENPYTFEDGIDYYAVVGAASDNARGAIIHLNNKYSKASIPDSQTVRSTLIRGYRMPAIRDVLTKEELNLLSYLGLSERQTLTFLDSKVPDDVSLPKFISESIFVQETNLKYKEKPGLSLSLIVEPYRVTGNEYRDRWNLVSEESWQDRTRGPVRIIR